MQEKAAEKETVEAIKLQEKQDRLQQLQHFQEDSQNSRLLREIEKEQYCQALSHQITTDSKAAEEAKAQVYTFKRPKVVRTDPLSSSLQASPVQEGKLRHLSVYGRMMMLPVSRVLPEPIYGKGRGLGYTDTRRLLI